MKKGQALLMMNMLAAEFGYRVKWILLPGEKRVDSVLLENDDGKSREFRGDDKFEQAVQWLREKA